MDSCVHNDGFVHAVSLANQIDGVKQLICPHFSYLLDLPTPLACVSPAHGWTHLFACTIEVTIACVKQHILMNSEARRLMLIHIRIRHLISTSTGRVTSNRVIGELIHTWGHKLQELSFVCEIPTLSLNEFLIEEKHHLVLSFRVQCLLLQVLQRNASRSRSTVMYSRAVVPNAATPFTTSFLRRSCSCRRCAN